MSDNIFKNKAYLAVGIIWLFHISALLGMTLGYIEWFIKKTPLNLCVCLVLFLWVYPIKNLKYIIAFVIFFLGGMISEWYGVTYGVLFGSYSYGDNFGPKVYGVPLLIGAYWALLTFVTASIAGYITNTVFLRIIIATLLMTFLDYFMEQSATRLNFWNFEGGIASFKNYFTWFVLSLLFQSILHYLKVRGNRFFSINLYAAQLIFFLYLFYLEI